MNPTLTRADHGDLPEMVRALEAQQTRKLDIVASAHTLRVDDEGLLRIEGVEPILTEDGVTDPGGPYRPTDTCDEGFAAKLRIPRDYLRRCHDAKPALYAANVNGWLAEQGDTRYMVRCLTGQDAGEGIARALLSDKYKVVDHLDVLFAALEGISAAGVSPEISRAQLTGRRMYVKVTCPQIAAYAPELMRGYRSPFSGESGDRLPVVFAGLIISNSETGDGAARITPALTFKICDNGATITKDAVKSVHLGGRLEDGQVDWSTRTLQVALDLVRSKTTDAVRMFLNRDYVEAKIGEMTALAGKPVPAPDKTIEIVARKLTYSDEIRAEILKHFIVGGQLTAGGVMHAVTSAAQTITDADLANRMEGDAMTVLSLAAAHS